MLKVKTEYNPQKARNQKRKSLILKCQSCLLMVLPWKMS